MRILNLIYLHLEDGDLAPFHDIATILVDEVPQLHKETAILLLLLRPTTPALQVDANDTPTTVPPAYVEQSPEGEWDQSRLPDQYEGHFERIKALYCPPEKVPLHYLEPYLLRLAPYVPYFISPGNQDAYIVLLSELLEQNARQRRTERAQQELDILKTLRAHIGPHPYLTPTLLLRYEMAISATANRTQLLPTEPSVLEVEEGAPISLARHPSRESSRSKMRQSKCKDSLKCRLV